MRDVKRLADEVERRLKEALPTLLKKVVKTLSPAVGTMLKARTPNTAELAKVLPLATARQDMREQRLHQLLKNPPLEKSAAILVPSARNVLEEGSLTVDGAAEFRPNGLGRSVCGVNAHRAGEGSLAAVDLGGVEKWERRISDLPANRW